MIRYSLICEKKQDFEIWFENSADYDRHAKRGLVTCPACGSVRSRRLLSGFAPPGRQPRGPGVRSDESRRRGRAIPHG